MRLVFFGTPFFAASILNDLLLKKANVVAVVTKPDKKSGRFQALQPPAVKKLAESHEIPVFQPLKASSPEFAEILKSFNADLFIVVAYSEILKENILAIPRLDCVNVHASLLPKFRGAAPIHRAVMAGEKETGVTIISMAKEMDAGDILGMKAIPLNDEITSGELFPLLSKIGFEALWEVIKEFEKGSVKKIIQDHQAATFAPKVTNEEGEIHWDASADSIHNKIRGLTPKPGAWCNVLVRGQPKRLIIKKSKIMPFLSGKPGAILPDQKELYIAARTGALHLLEVQLEGKKALPAQDFLRGILKEELVFI